MRNKRNPMVAYKAHGAGYTLFFLGAGAPMASALRISEPLDLEADRAFNLLGRFAQNDRFG